MKISTTTAASLPAPSDTLPNAPLAERAQAPLLPSPSDRLTASGDVGAQIAAFLIKAGREGREAAQKSRDAALANEAAALETKIEAMERAAGERLAGGLVSGGLTVAAGGMGIASGSSGEGASRRWAGGGKVAEGGAAISKATSEFVAAGSDRDVESAEISMKQANRAAESAESTEDDSRELIKTAVDAYREYLASRDAAQKATVLKA